ncbi:WXG100 family type VII secretion target [Micromonospora marina]|uniref:WXG100 family type VII secretion target n=1 Tax=Micromonospora marina TaxID=307120 RepID=UPI0034557D40
MTLYTVSFTRVQEILGQMEAAGRRIDAMLDGLEQQSQRSLAEWQSTARDEYQRSKQRWDQSASQMRVQLTQASRALSEIMELYQATDRQNARQW